MWIIVIFLKENSVECIPSCWLTDSTTNKCYWPPYRGSRLKSAISTCEKPQEDWDIFRIRTLNGDKVYDQLVQARNACDRAQYKSDVSDFDDEMKRKPKKKIISSSSEDEEENGFSGYNLKIPPPPSKIPSKPREYSEHVDKIPEPKGKKKVEKRVVAPSTSISFFSESGVNSISEGQNTEDISSQKIINPTETSKLLQEFQHIVRKLNIINVKVDEMAADITQMHNLLRDRNETRVEVNIDFTLPLNTVEELEYLEAELINKEKYAKFFAYVEKIGGCSEYDNVKRIFGRIFANELATQYNWLGLKKKKPLNSLLLTKIAKDAILKNPRIQNATEKSIEFAMKNWLRHAKDRVNKGAESKEVVENPIVAPNQEVEQAAEEAINPTQCSAIDF